MSTNLLGSPPAQDADRVTVVLVHGAFAESASWNPVIALLQAAGHPVIAAANPIRSLDGDSAFVASIIDAVVGPVVAVGHSYGGSVISNAARGRDHVKALVFVAAFAPVEGESIAHLSGSQPGSTLGDTLASVTLSDGSTDLYIRQDAYQRQFAADVPAQQAALDAATQRPLRDAALNGEAGPPAWEQIPSWFIYPELDLNIPLAVHRSMAERAHSRKTVEVAGASHSLALSHPEEVAELILAAAQDVG